MSDPQQPAGGEPRRRPVAADGDARPRRAVASGFRSRAVPTHVPVVSDAERTEREISRHAWLSGVPLDPEEPGRFAEDARP